MNFTINNDEIEKISKRIRALQEIKRKNGDFSLEENLEYTNLFKIKDILIKANQIDDPNKYIVIDGMRVSKTQVNKLFLLGETVNVEDLEFTRPPYLGEVIPGTKTKMPRQMNPNESVEAYEEYLVKFYRKIGYKFDIVEYYPNTIVPKIRKPYPHEMYYPTEDGFAYDSKYLGRKNSYYVQMRKYYQKQLIKEYKRLASESLSALVEKHKDILTKKNPIRVAKVEVIPSDFIHQKNKDNKLTSKIKVVNTEPVVSNNVTINAGEKITFKNYLKSKLKVKKVEQSSSLKNIFDKARELAFKTEETSQITHPNYVMETYMVTKSEKASPSLLKQAKNAFKKLFNFNGVNDDYSLTRNDERLINKANNVDEIIKQKSGKNIVNSDEKRDALILTALVMEIDYNNKQDVANVQETINNCITKYSENPKWIRSCISYFNGKLQMKNAIRKNDILFNINLDTIEDLDYKKTV